MNEQDLDNTAPEVVLPEYNPAFNETYAHDHGDPNIMPGVMANPPSNPSPYPQGLSLSADDYGTPAPAPYTNRLSSSVDYGSSSTHATSPCASPGPASPYHSPYHSTDYANPPPHNSDHTSPYTSQQFAPPVDYTNAGAWQDTDVVPPDYEASARVNVDDPLPSYAEAIDDAHPVVIDEPEKFDYEYPEKELETHSTEEEVRDSERDEPEVRPDHELLGVGYSSSGGNRVTYKGQPFPFCEFSYRSALAWFCLAIVLLCLCIALFVITVIVDIIVFIICIATYIGCILFVIPLVMYFICFILFCCFVGALVFAIFILIVAMCMSCCCPEKLPE